MDFDPELIKQLIDMFQVELEQNAQIITDGLLALEKGSLTTEEKTTTINEIFRAAHNIKGTARGIGSGINDVAEIAHSIETLFAAIKNDTVSITAPLISVCLDAVDKMRLAMKAFVDKTPLPFVLNDVLAQLGQQTSANPATNKKETIPSPVPPASAKAPVAVEPKPTQPIEAKSIHVSLNSLDKVSALMEEIQANKIALIDNFSDTSKVNNALKRFDHLWKQMQVTLKGHAGNQLGESYAKLHVASADTLAEITNTVSNLHQDMEIQINELTTLTNTLQEEIRTLRLIPANNLLCTFPRYVRDLALELDKQIDFTITGDSVKIDKMVLEGLHEPLNHLIRNALDHGIESREVRAKFNKPPEGHITIEVRGEGSYITIKVSDDGAGIDHKQIAKIALEKNIITQAELDTMDESGMLDLIFRPGFSTKTTVSQISGRGIGLDVVKANIDNLKGNLHIVTEVGKGTTFILQMPLTLASERGFLISCGGQTFVIPTSAIEQVLIANADDVENIEASQALLIDDHPVHLIALSDILHLEQHLSPNQQQLSVVIVKQGRLKIALVVDEILGEREIVIKSLQAPLHNVPCIAGGTMSGSGQVILVLDANDIINSAFHMVQSTRIQLQSESDKAEKRVKPHILVVDDSITTRTLEKNVLESNNYQVTTAVDGKEAWELLQKQKFVLLITDGMMPNMDGFTLTANVKNSDKLKHLPVILVTSLDSAEEKKRGMDAGADYYIVKSEFESGALLSIVRQLV